MFWGFRAWDLGCARLRVLVLASGNRIYKVWGSRVYTRSRV